MLAPVFRRPASGPARRHLGAAALTQSAAPGPPVRRSGLAIRLTLCHHPDGLHVFPGAGLAALDMVSRTRLSSSLVVRYMTVCSYIEQMTISRSSFPILR
jgi:hypothetical protein